MQRYRLELAEEGLTFKEDDLFYRSEFAEKIVKIADSVSYPLVLSLEAPWGEGKTTFCHKLEKLLKESAGIESLYIDAYKGDYNSDAFTFLASEIYGFAKERLGEGSPAEKSLLSSLKSVGAATSKAALKTFVGAATAGIFSSSDFDDFEKHLESEYDKIAEKAIDRAITSSEARKENFKALEKSLEQFVEQIGAGKNIVVIVDELDRARPSFSLDILENIKHLFNVEGIVFLLVNNREQLEESVRCEYGTGVDAGAYLRKFFDLSLRLPKGERVQRDKEDVEAFVTHCFDQLGYHHPDRIESYAYTISSHYQGFGLSLRDIEKLCLLLMVHSNRIYSNSEMAAPLTYLEVGMAVICLRRRGLVEKIYDGSTTWEDIVDVLNFKRTMDQDDGLHYVWAVLLGKKNILMELNTLSTAFVDNVKALNSPDTLVRSARSFMSIST